MDLMMVFSFWGLRTTVMLVLGRGSDMFQVVVELVCVSCVRSSVPEELTRQSGYVLTAN